MVVAPDSAVALPLKLLPIASVGVIFLTPFGLAALIKAGLPELNGAGVVFVPSPADKEKGPPGCRRAFRNGVLNRRT